MPSGHPEAIPWGARTRGEQLMYSPGSASWHGPARPTTSRKFACCRRTIDRVDRHQSLGALDHSTDPSEWPDMHQQQQRPELRISAQMPTNETVT